MFTPPTISNSTKSMPLSAACARNKARRESSRQPGPSDARICSAAVTLTRRLSDPPRREEALVAFLARAALAEHDAHGQHVVGGGHLDAVHGDDWIQPAGQRALDEKLRGGGERVRVRHE